MADTHTGKIRVLICDDHPMMVFGVREFLSLHPQIEVIGLAETGEQAIATSMACSPDVILMDIRLPDMSGIDATRLILRDRPAARVILLTMYDDDEYVRQFIQSGASGYVLKKSPPEELLRAIESVSRGQAFFSPSISLALLRVGQEARGEHSQDDLTERERQILISIARGLTSKEIADKLGISVRTVGKHREMIMSKLGIHSVADLTTYAISKKLLIL